MSNAIVALFGVLIAAGMFTGSGVLFHDYEISAYWFALLISMEGLVTLTLVCYLVRQCVIPRFTIETEEVTIEYTVEQNKIAGSIGQLFQGRA